MRLKDKVAIVTGGSSGIGQATALLFAQEGANVIIADINSQGGTETAQRIVNEGGSALFFEVDLTASESIKEMVTQSLKVYGQIDILSNNAGIIYFGDVITCTQTEWEKILAVNLMGAFLCSKHVVPIMMEQNEGSIIHVASIGGLVGVENATAYAASKGGVVQLVRSMALDFGKFNIRVNGICPGSIETPMLTNIWQMEGKISGKTLEEMREDYKNGRPLKRIGTPNDIAYAELYLASDESQFVTGTFLIVDGGMSAM